MSALIGAGAIVLLLVAALDTANGSLRALLWWVLAIAVGAASYYLWPPEAV